VVHRLQGGATGGHAVHRIADIGDGHCPVPLDPLGRDFTLLREHSESDGHGAFLLWFLLRVKIHKMKWHFEINIAI
jgi:hypothetical protein